MRSVSDTLFDVNRAARLELEWWIIHRERAKHAEGDLARALAELQAELYHLPVEKLMGHGRPRADAMTIRDTKAEAGGRLRRRLAEDWRVVARLVAIAFRGR